MKIHVERRRAERGFTLFELLIVCAIIAAICAISIPAAIDYRYSGNEASAANWLRTLYTAETQFQTKNARYGTVDELATAKLLQPSTVQAYVMVLTIPQDGQSWSATADPLVRPDRLRHFFIDLSGVLRFKTGAAADTAAAPV